MEQECEPPEGLLISGELGIGRAGEIRAALLGMAEREETVITFGDVTAMDISFLQLLCSANRSFAKKGKSLTLDQSTSAPLLKAVREAGFVRLNRCPGDACTACLWIEETL